LPGCMRLRAELTMSAGAINAFMYRRLCRWITCNFQLPFGAQVALRTKYDIASAQDVFCHPYYWQLYSWLPIAPELVVDAGANCGHFSILLDTCTRVAFGQSGTRYLLVEPNAALIPILSANLERAGMAGRFTIVEGLLGAKSGSSTLWVHPKNFLASSMKPLHGARARLVSFIDLMPLIAGQEIDVLKVDIEGGEYPFVQHNGDVLARSNLVVMEVHDAPDTAQARMFEAVQATGLQPLGRPVDADGLRMRAWSRVRRPDPSRPPSQSINPT
jgi:FkbM family methyltransferase